MVTGHGDTCKKELTEIIHTLFHQASITLFNFALSEMKVLVLLWTCQWLYLNAF